MFFLSKKSQKETFFDILDKKESWVSPWFCLKIDLFLIRFYLRKKGRKKHFLIFCLENKVFWTSKVKFSQSRKKSTICKGVSPWFFFEKSTFSSYFFFSKKRKKERFFDILDRKECFLDHKKNVLKTLKNRHFAKGLVHGFCQKIDLFLIFFFEQKKAERNNF